jgi:DNA-binding response OmpR family regulator
MSTYKVLVVEDDPNDLFLLEAALRKEKLEFECVTCGRDAMALLADKSREFDALLLNLSLPDIGGEQIAYWCKRERPELPIAIVSGALDPAKSHQLALLGPVLICMKPFRDLELLMNIMQSRRTNYERGKGSRSWRTTFFGVLAIASSSLSVGWSLLDGDPSTNPDWSMHASICWVGLGLIFASDRLSGMAEGLKLGKLFGKKDD